MHTLKVTDSRGRITYYHVDHDGVVEVRHQDNIWRHRLLDRDAVAHKLRMARVFNDKIERV